MTLRTRLAVLTAVAVAVAVATASVAAWLLIRTTLLSQVDEELRSHVPQADQIAADLPKGDTGSGAFRELDDDQVGAELISSDGSVVARLPSGTVTFEVDRDQGESVGAGRTPHLQDETIDGVRYRVMSTPLNHGGVLRLAKPLDDLDATMGKIAWLLSVVAVVGMVVSGAVGWVISRMGLRPVRRLAIAAETVARTRDLGHRVEVRGGSRGEVARVATSINEMLTALDEARDQQRRLVEDVGHELRTPLTTLRNDLGVLLQLQERPRLRLSDEDHANLLRDLNVEASVLSSLVSEVLDLARGDVEPEPVTWVDVADVVAGAVERNRRLNPAVEIVVNARPAVTVVRAAALERGIANLVRNAVQASSAGQRVEVETRDRGDRVEVRVRDRGIGLDEDEIERLFDRFYRGAGSRSRPGSGLGLAIVAQVADWHQGTVLAENRPGGGAVFTLQLPRSHDDGDSRA